jgi:hypothetical protein
MKDKLCFIIGPMRNMARLNTRADEIVKPVIAARFCCNSSG